MAVFNKFQVAVRDIAAGVHNLATGTPHVLKVLLTNTAPTAANAVKADLTEIAAGNGYAAGGISIGTLTGAQTAGVFKLTGGTNPVFTASGGPVGPFRYAVLYNDTPTSPAKPLLGFYDYGSNVTLNAGESLTVALDATNGVLTLT